MFKILYLYGEHDSAYNFKEAVKHLAEKFPGHFQVSYFQTSVLDEEEKAFAEAVKLAREANFIFLVIHGGLSFFRRFADFFQDRGETKIYIKSGMEDEAEELLAQSGLTVNEYAVISQYYGMGGCHNLAQVILWLANRFGQGDYLVEKPQKLQWEGIYDPVGVLKDEEEYLRKIEAAKQPVVAILFHTKLIQEKNTKHIDCLIKHVRKLGAVPLAIYTDITKNKALGSKGIKWVIQHYLKRQGRPLVNAVINTTAFSVSVLANPGDGTKMITESILNQLGVPVIQAMTTYFTLEQWEKSLQGIDMMSLSSNVYHPEFDGQIISVPIAYSELIKDEIGEKRVFLPIEERAEKVCRLAVNWAKLRQIPNQEKKVAIIFHNMPPRNDMIGCAYGLDSPAAVDTMVKALQKIGIKTDYDFKNGTEIIERIIVGVTNDARWMSPERMLEKCAAAVAGERYKAWFDRFGEKVQQELVSDWGEPPGDFMVSEGKMVIPGIINGHIFIGLQPPRAFEEKAEECYHSTDLVCPHQYLGFYRWIKHDFGAHVIIHVGTHGTLEWLPGKEIGLSKDCYPDLAIDDLPHLYPYIINVPGEGVQVKRRSYGVLISHLIPSLQESDTYGELADMDALIKEYFHAQKGDVGKLPYLQEQIWELAKKLELHNDLNVTKEAAMADFDGFLQNMHAWMEKIKSSLIKDGLHLFGEAPAGERLKNMLRALVRLRNGDIPSLPEAIAACKGLDYEQLLAEPTAFSEPGKTNLMVLEEINLDGRKLFAALAAQAYSETAIDRVVNEFLQQQQIEPAAEGVAKLTTCLRFVCTDLLPRLNSTVDEIHNLINGVNGEFVPPGPSGCPTRGQARILPTGRNFYTIDPAAVPTRAAWEVGKRLGDDLLKRYLDEEGKYPENVAIIIYAGETMKTCGDDVAEILYLLGIKPKWLGNTDRVIGLEVIPPEELGRPRIDVTLRISGLFRDTFPNLIGFVEDAIALAAAQEEDYSVNFVRKHILEEVEGLLSRGIPLVEAQEQASLRIFGCPPGTYGAGVDILINSKKWDDVEDLGRIYTQWSGYAYGRKIHGEAKQEVFVRRLAQTEVTIKNESSMEVDIYDDDDFYNYHGGLIAAVRTHSGRKPRSYCGDSSDPERTEIRDVRQETARVMRARILNPKWFEGLKKHGYKGAQEVSGVVDRVFGWDATADVIEDWMYDRIADYYVKNEENRRWLEEQNPWALHSIVERLLEAEKRKMWNAKAEDLQELKRIYLQTEGSVEEYV